MKTAINLLPQLERGQLWRTDLGYIQVWHIGKRLIEYKMMKELGRKAVKTHTTAIDTLGKYLKTHRAVLTGAS